MNEEKAEAALGGRNREQKGEVHLIVSEDLLRWDQPYSPSPNLPAVEK